MTKVQVNPDDEVMADVLGVSESGEDVSLARVRLNREQTRQAIQASLKAFPGLSDREHARRLGVSHATVGKVRKQVIS